MRFTTTSLWNWRNKEQKAPSASAWAAWCLHGFSFMHLGPDLLLCETGVQQGDPLAPLLFSVGIHSAVEALAQLSNLEQVWYLDDGFIKGPRGVVERALSMLCPLLAAKGLHVNRSKCELYAVGPAALGQGSLADVPLVINRDHWSYLGAPLWDCVVHFKEIARHLRGRGTAGKSLPDAGNATASGYHRCLQGGISAAVPAFLSGV